MDGFIDFSSNFLQESLQGGENVVVSPYSLYSVLFLLWLGGKGKTAEDISKVLHIKPGTPRKLIKTLEDPGMVTASHIYIANGANISNTSFKDFAEIVDFSQESTADKINEWMAKVTNGKLKEFIDPHKLNPKTVMLLLNALYFKGLWQQPFDSVHDGKFTNFDQSESHVMFLSDIRKFNSTYLPKFDTRVVEIPYADTEISLIICLPSSPSNLKKLISHLKSVQDEIFNLKYNSYLSVSIPEFKIETTIQLNSILKKLGMAVAFSNDADFTNLVDGHVKLSSAWQKSVIEVDEKGTEAASGTGVDLIPRMSIDAVNCEHPFLFFLYHKSERIPVMAGVVRDRKSVV